jgi:hypothetical protein
LFSTCASVLCTSSRSTASSMLTTPLLPARLVACSPKPIVLAPTMRMHRTALLTGRASVAASGLLAVLSLLRSTMSPPWLA